MTSHGGMTEICDTLNLNGAFLRRLVPQKRQPEDSPPAPLSDIQVAMLRNRLSTVMLSQGMDALMLCGLRSAYSYRSAQLKPKPSSAVGPVLRSSRYAKATVSKDKVYGLCGLLGTSAIDELMRSFDKTADKVFFAATLYVLQKDAHPNMYHEYPTIPQSRAKTSNVPHRPSACRAWQNSPPRCSRWHRPHSYRFSHLLSHRASPRPARPSGR